jgi:hypothetical protein
VSSIEVVIGTRTHTMTESDILDAPSGTAWRDGDIVYIRTGSHQVPLVFLTNAGRLMVSSDPIESIAARGLTPVRLRIEVLR